MLSASPLSAQGLQHAGTTSWWAGKAGRAGNAGRMVSELVGWQGWQAACFVVQHGKKTIVRYIRCIGFWSTDSNWIACQVTGCQHTEPKGLSLANCKAAACKHAPVHSTPRSLMAPEGAGGLNNELDRLLSIDGVAFRAVSYWH